MALSSNALFHFTSSLDVLKLILNDQSFWPQYCIEYDKGKLEDDSYYAVPMVCFCDIPLSAIQEHISDYGNYGIGMSKQWAKKNVSPITYYKNEKSLSKSLYNSISKSLDVCQKMKWFSLLKRYYGETWSASKNRYRKKVLYNEREWRYVPRSLKKDEAFKKVTDPSTFDSLTESTCTKRFSLSFSYKDIKYLFVKTEDDRNELISYLHTTLSETDLKTLKASILTIKQIKEDF